MSLSTANKAALKAEKDEAATERVFVETKYGPLVVHFGGEHGFECHDMDRGRYTETVRRARVYTPSEKPLMVNGVEYQVRADLSYGPHGEWDKAAKDSRIVTGWCFWPGEYPSINREKHFGQFSTWTAEPTDKARSTIRDLILESIQNAAKTFPEAVEAGLAAWLDEQAERAEKEANEAACAMREKQNAAHLLRNRAQETRFKASL